MTFMTSSGRDSYPIFAVNPNSRKTIRVNDSLPNRDFSTKVRGSRPTIAERSMYWDSPAGETSGSGQKVAFSGWGHAERSKCNFLT
jgi:hypothetical protein